MVPGLTVREVEWAEMQHQELIKRAGLNHMASRSQTSRIERIRDSWIGTAVLYASALALLVALATV